MQGTRLIKDPGEQDFLWCISETPGAYGTGNGKDWYCTTPNGLLGNLGAHQVEEHEDGTITVRPSILVTGGGADTSYHGFLERGVWRDC
jgi:hypothetical protein